MSWLISYLYWMLWATAHPAVDSLHTSVLHLNVLWREVRQDVAGFVCLQALSREEDFFMALSGTRGCRWMEKSSVEERLRKGRRLWKGISWAAGLGWRRFIHFRTMMRRLTSFLKWKTQYWWGHAGTCRGWSRWRQRQWHGAEMIIHANIWLSITYYNPNQARNIFFGFRLSL